MKAQRLRVIPLVIDQLDVAVTLAAFFERDTEPLADRLLAHRLMRAECDHHIERPGR